MKLVIVSNFCPFILMCFDAMVVFWVLCMCVCVCVCLVCVCVCVCLVCVCVCVCVCVLLFFCCCFFGHQLGLDLCCSYAIIANNGNFHKHTLLVFNVFTVRPRACVELIGS